MRFLLVILFYGGMQAYFVAKVMQAFSLSSLGRILLIGFAVLMTFGPLLLWRLERCDGCHALAVSGAWLMFCWMGFSFLFFWFGLVLDGSVLAAGAMKFGTPGPMARLVFVSAVTLGCCLFGFYDAWHPRVERLDIRSDKLPADFQELRIVQISDVHLGMLIGRQRLSSILAQVAALKPDVLISTGDLVDAQAQYLDGLSTQFAAFQPRYGKFAVTGNHEHYAGLDHALDFHARSGFNVLRERAVELPDGVVLAGVDDPAVLAGSTAEARMLSALPADKYVILLKHQPVVERDARFDLQLSGHTHAGQVFPFGLFVARVYPMSQGLHALANGGSLYVSRGTGTWGPPIRFLEPPEITLITLKGKAAPSSSRSSSSVP